MQTPVGYGLVDGRFFPTDWLDIVFNPSFPYRLMHNNVAFFVTTGFVVLGVGAWLVRRGRSVIEGEAMMRMAFRTCSSSSCRCRCTLATCTGRNTLQ